MSLLINLHIFHDYHTLYYLPNDTCTAYNNSEDFFIPLKVFYSLNISNLNAYSFRRIVGNFLISFAEPHS